MSMFDGVNGVNTIGAGAMYEWELNRDDFFDRLPEDVQEAVNDHADQFRSLEEMRDYTREQLRRS